PEIPPYPVAQDAQHTYREVRYGHLALKGVASRPSYRPSRLVRQKRVAQEGKYASDARPHHQNPHQKHLRGVSESARLSAAGELHRRSRYGNDGEDDGEKERTHL